MPTAHPARSGLRHECSAAGTADGGVELFSLEGQQRGKWQPLAFADGARGTAGASCRSVRILSVDGTHWVVAGGGDGRIFLAEIDPSAEDCFEGALPAREMLPKHGGAVVAFECAPIYS